MTASPWEAGRGVRPMADRWADAVQQIRAGADGLRERIEQQGPLWPGVAATVVGLVLLLAFLSVVRGAVAQGDQRRLASQAHAEATAQCSRLPQASARQACLVRLSRAAE